MPIFALAALVVAQSFFGGLPIDGIACNANEGAVEHIHAHLQIFDRGKPVAVPANIGIPAGAGCLYWVHTHAAGGYVHIESPVTRTFTLGQFFDIWDQQLSWTRAASAAAPAGRKIFVWVDGKPWHGSNPRAIVLHDRQSIVIQSAAPFAKPGRSDWTTL
ncbi:MAG TPA: hypothetical protein VGF86_11880 [Candidatus Tumulicola sp.]|jgi:hypothetical protein